MTERIIDGAKWRRMDEEQGYGAWDIDLTEYESYGPESCWERHVAFGRTQADALDAFLDRFDDVPPSDAKSFPISRIEDLDVPLTDHESDEPYTYRTLIRDALKKGVQSGLLYCINERD